MHRDDIPGPPTYASGRNEANARIGGGLDPNPECLKGNDDARQQLHQQLNRLRYAETEGPYQPTIRERLYTTIRDAEHLQRRGDRARRALALLEAHPDVAELVELLREF